MPSARPRLVAEGTPLEQQQQGNEFDEDDDHAIEHFMEETMNHNQSSSRQYERNNKSRPFVYAPTAAASSNSSSSLAAAAGISSKKPTGNYARMQHSSNRAHRYTVGQEDAMDDEVLPTITPAYSTFHPNTTTTMEYHPRDQQHYQHHSHPTITTTFQLPPLMPPGQPQQPPATVRTPVSQLFAPVQEYVPPSPHHYQPPQYQQQQPQQQPPQQLPIRHDLGNVHSHPQYRKLHSDGDVILPPHLHHTTTLTHNTTYPLISHQMPSSSNAPYTPPSPHNYNVNLQQQQQPQHQQKPPYQPPQHQQYQQQHSPPSLSARAPTTGTFQQANNTPPPSSSSRRHHYQIGNSEQEAVVVAQEQHSSSSYEDHDVIERMYGIEDHSIKPPLVVIDGANVAYAYTEAMAGGGGTTSLSYHKQSPQIEPDVHGIQVAVSYFQLAGCRVLVVLPTWWLRLKPRAGDVMDGNAKMQTPQLEILQQLKAQGVLVTSPPRDDDDAYALTIARREHVRARQAPQHYQQQGPSGFVLSNDMFRDAMERDATGQLATWLNQGSSNGTELFPGRISYAFCDMGTVDEYGDPELDIVPNPKHPLVRYIETSLQYHQQQQLQTAT